VAKIDMASVTQKIAIRIDTAAAFIAFGFIPSGSGIIIIKVNTITPKTIPIF
jgi:hypothetical protein